MVNNEQATGWKTRSTANDPQAAGWKTRSTEDESKNSAYADALLADIQRSTSKSGKLHIFLGMCPGVGKTYAMLQTARQRLNEGVNVLVGIVETHGRAETAALLEGMSVLPRKQFEHRGFTLEELDIDTILEKKPQLVLVDELAHTNVHGSRHTKRYQDVLELIDSGIDVYTTLNVQHIESQVDIVRQISGVTVSETVPDSVLDRAYEIQLIDLSSEKLLERMGEGKVYLGERAELAVSNFFKEGNLTALRELALRFTAEQVDRDLEDIRRAKRVTSPWKTSARLMVGVGPSPYAESLIRWTRRAATRLNCPWLVVWVEGSRSLSPIEQERLTRALGLARKLGAEVVSVTGENVSDALLQVASERNVSQIVVGKPEKSHFWQKSLADRLILGSGDIDVCVIRPLAAHEKTRQNTKEKPPSTSSIGDYGWTAAMVFAIASVFWPAVSLTGYMFVALVFLLAIVLAALRFPRGPVIAMAALSAICWNFFFIPPRFTLHISKPEDFIMFALFFIVAVSMGNLTSQLRSREVAERRRLRQTDALLRITQSAALSTDPEKGLGEAMHTINELLLADSALVVWNPEEKKTEIVSKASSFHPSTKEWGVVNWSYQNKKCAGRFTGTLPESEATWFPLETSTALMGVLGIKMPQQGNLDFTLHQTIEAFALQLAMVLEKEFFMKVISEAEVFAKSEKLHRTLLDSVSHELKTPLAVIQASLEGLSDSENPYLTEIATATQRLQRVVDGLLHMTRLESGVVKPIIDWCDLNDVISAARQAVGPSLEKHPVKLHIPEDFPLLKLDHTLLSQALANILQNACLYTPEGAQIEISVTLSASHRGAQSPLRGRGTERNPVPTEHIPDCSEDEEPSLLIAVRDHGQGLLPGMEQKIFEKFYRATGAPPGGTGLGLAIARGFVRALGGDITAHNHPEGGAEFVIEIKRVFQLVSTAPPAIEPTSEKNPFRL